MILLSESRLASSLPHSSSQKPFSVRYLPCAACFNSPSRKLPASENTESAHPGNPLDTNGMPSFTIVLSGCVGGVAYGHTAILVACFSIGRDRRAIPLAGERLIGG